MVQAMSPDDQQEFRVARLQDLMNAKYGGQKAALGRALGHKSGAFVRQLLARERPVTEKTVQALEGLPGCAGWFDADPASSGPETAQGDSTGSVEDLQSALTAIRNQLARAHGGGSVQVGDALKLLAMTPDSEIAFRGALDALLARPATSSPPAVEILPQGVGKSAVYSRALLERVAKGNNNPRELSVMMELLDNADLLAKREQRSSELKADIDVKNHEG